VVKRAVLYVWDRTGIVEFAKGLIECGYEIISAGETGKELVEAGVTVVTIPEEQLFDRITTNDIVAINLYPLREILLKKDNTIDDIMRNLDINSPYIIKASARNYKDTAVLINSKHYSVVIKELRTYGKVSTKLKLDLAYTAFEYIAHYDALVASYLRDQNQSNEFPDLFTVTFEKLQDLRYGENPHQQAIYYKESIPKAGSLTSAVQVHGNELSFNNINDANIAISLLKEFSNPTVVAVKHANPCGVGTASTVLEAYKKAYNADRVSIYDGVVAINCGIDKVTAEEISRTFSGLVIASSYTKEAYEVLIKKQDIKLLALKDIAKEASLDELDIKKVSGGLLLQKIDSQVYEKDEVKCVTNRKPTAMEIEQLDFAWLVAKHVKCNAIVLAKDNATVGIGPGQMNRITALNIAIERGKENTIGSVMASDGFFFKDCVIAAKKAGVTAIIQPGRPIEDQDLIDECNEAGIAMLLTGMRHFKH